MSTLPRYRRFSWLALLLSVPGAVLSTPPVAWGQSQAPVANVRVHKAANVAALSVAANFPRIKDGDACDLLGYDAMGDDGGQRLCYHRTGRSGITEDGGFYFDGFLADDYWEAADKTAAIARRFGVKADDSTNDTAALQAALAAAEANLIPLILPAGACRFNQTLVVDETIAIRGAGGGGIVADATTKLVKTADVVGIQVLAEHVELSDFVLTSNIVAGSASGIEIGQTDGTNGATFCDMRNLTVERHYGSGIWAKNGNAGRMDHVRVFANVAHGLRLDSTNTVADNVNAWQLSLVTAVSNGGDGIHVGASVANVLDVYSEGNTGWGLRLERSYQQVRGYLESNTAGSLYVGASCFNSFINLYTVNGTESINNADNWINLMKGDGDSPDLTSGGLMSLTPTLPGGTVLTVGKTSDSAQTAIHGKSSSTYAIIGESTGGTAGIQGIGNAASVIGVFGLAGTGAGVRGQSNSSGQGVAAIANTGQALFAQQAGASSGNAVAYLQRDTASTGTGDILTLEDRTSGGGAFLSAYGPSSALKFQVSASGALAAISNVRADTDGHTITAIQAADYIHTNEGASGSQTFTLPDAVAGMTVTFFLVAAQDIDIDPNGSERILNLTNANGDKISSDATAGSWIKLTAVNATQWFPNGSAGTWTDAD